MERYSMFMDIGPNIKITSSSQLDLYILPNPKQIPESYFVNVDKPILKFIWKDKRCRIGNTILKKHKVGGLTLPAFKTY